MISLGSGNVRGNAYFDSVKNVIYISDVETEKDKAVIAHEICHYLSDGKTDAAGIRIGDFWSGQYFIEGCTTYLSSKVYPFPEKLSVYEFETHCAEMIAQAYGEDEFIKCYFNGDMENIREDFNKTLENIYPNEMYEKQVSLTPFDVYVGNLNMYYLLLNSITPEEMQGQVEFLGALVDSCEETSQIYNSLKGKDASSLTKNFVDNEFMIPWSMITHLAQMK